MGKPVPKVLQVVTSTQRGSGLEAFVIGAYRNVDHERVQFDFVSHGVGPSDLTPEIEDMGGRVFEIPLITSVGIVKYMRLLDGVVRSGGPYHATHSHLDYQAWITARAARKSGVPIRICHAHRSLGAASEAGASTRAKLALGRAMTPIYATGLCACSKQAALSVFGKSGAYAAVIHNGIDTAQYSSGVSGEYKETLCELIGARGRRTILIVARHDKAKNFPFVMELAKAIKSRNLPWTIVSAGRGPETAVLLRRRSEESLEAQLCFLGNRDDVPLLMQASDALILPSFSEGFGNVVVEAQAAGLPVIASQGVPSNTDMDLGLLRFLPITPVERAVGVWLAAIDDALHTPRPAAVDCSKRVESNGFGISHTVGQLMRLYGLS